MLSHTQASVGMLLLLAVFCTSATGFAAAAGLPQSIEAQAKDLLKLDSLILDPDAAISVDQVLAAYKDYVRLYELQSSAAATSKRAGAADAAEEDTYKAVTELLARPGVQIAADSVFGLFKGAPAPDSLRDDEREVIEKAIISEGLGAGCQ
jgi:hypothetical protein